MVRGIVDSDALTSFDPADPYPLAFAGDYRDAQAHAGAVDAWLGLGAEAVESSLNGRQSPEGQRLWLGLPVQAMLTPYVELRAMLERLSPRPGETVIDLGAGYGRMGFVLARHFSQVRFVGYELVAERVAEGRRALDLAGARAPGVRLEAADLAAESFELPPAEHYFIYDYGSRGAIDKTLGDLRRIAGRRAITVIGRGRATRDAIERGHPWLAEVVQPEHCGNFSIYRSA